MTRSGSWRARLVARIYCSRSRRFIKECAQVIYDLRLTIGFGKRGAHGSGRADREVGRGTARSVLECGSPLPLFQRGGTIQSARAGAVQDLSSINGDKVVPVQTE